MSPGHSPRPAPRVPRHVAIIMDGNGRWAEQRGLPRSQGHQAGLANLREILRAFSEHGVRYVTLYAFSTENWSRPRQEVQGLMSLLAEAVERDAHFLDEDGVRILHLGRIDRLAPELGESIRRVMEMTKTNQRITLGVAFDYGGRDEILEAVRGLIRDGHGPEEVTEELFSRQLYTSELPDPDLVIRTGGEMRLSNFLLWQSAYAEFYSTSALWPDFGVEEVSKALAAYKSRDRRFGALDSGD